MNPEESQPQATGSFFQRIIKYKKILIPLFVLILILIPLTFLISSKNKSQEPPPTTSSKSKMWEIRFAYDTEKQVLTVRSVTLKDGRATASNLGLSPYKLQVLDKNKNIIYQTDIHITERILYDIYIPPEATGSAVSLPPQPKEFEDIVYIPYLSNAQKAEVLKQGNKILEFTFPKISSFSLINQAYAIGGECTTNLKIVFVSDGYASESKFNSDVQQVTGKFKSQSPYSENPDIFDIKSIYNTESLGCNLSGVLNNSCLGSSQAYSKTRAIAFNKYPGLEGVDQDHLKLIILADADPEPFGSLLILGAIRGVGSDFGVFQTRSSLLKVASHEVLGHGIGYLYDRYIYGDSSDPDGNDKLRDVSYQSNCTGNSQGVPFWNSISGTQVSQGCTSQYMYAPYPRDCGNAGSSQSMMSAVPCGASEFDLVEQAWIRNNIMSKYQSCQSAGAPTSNPTLIPTVPAGGNCGAYGCDGPSLRVSWTKNVLAFYGYAIQLTQAGTLSPACNGITNPCTDHAITAETSYTFTGLSPITKYDLYVYVIQVRPTPDSFWKSYSNLGPTGACQGGFCSPSSSPTLIPTRTLPTGLPPASITSPPGESTPTPTSIATYTCVEDRSNCSQGQNNLQLCPLICTPQ